MATIQHKDIPDAQLHQPKGIVTAADKQVYVADGLSGGTWRKIRSTDIDMSNKAYNVFGWNDVADSLYTSGSPRSISAVTRTQITNNGAMSQTDQSRLGVLWDTSNNQFLINDLNSAYTLRIMMKVKADAAAGTPYALKIELESSSGPTVVSASDITIKGGGYENDVYHSTIVYQGSTINNSPLKVYVTPDTNITLYKLGFVIQRTYKEV